MDELKQKLITFHKNCRQFIEGCDKLEEAGLWNKEALGEMEAFYLNDMASVVIRLIALDKNISEKEVKYLKESFGFSYTVDELAIVYENSKENLQEYFDEDLSNAVKYLWELDRELADCYQKLIYLICDIIASSDGIVLTMEKKEIERLMAMCKPQ